jgi:hypothetical protein
MSSFNHIQNGSLCFVQKRVSLHQMNLWAKAQSPRGKHQICQEKNLRNLATMLYTSFCFHKTHSKILQIEHVIYKAAMPNRSSKENEGWA